VGKRGKGKKKHAGSHKGGKRCETKETRISQIRKGRREKSGARRGGGGGGGGGGVGGGGGGGGVVWGGGGGGGWGGGGVGGGGGGVGLGGVVGGGGGGGGGMSWEAKKSVLYFLAGRTMGEKGQLAGRGRVVAAFLKKEFGDIFRQKSRLQGGIHLLVRERIWVGEIGRDSRRKVDH